MRHHPPPGVLLGLSLTKSLLIGLALALALGLGATADRPRRPERRARAPRCPTRRVTRLMDRLRVLARPASVPTCIPNSALIHLDGQVKRVSFDRGWAVFTGDEPGTLMAVCRR